MHDCNVVCCLGLWFLQPVSIQKPEKGGTKTRDLLLQQYFYMAITVQKMLRNPAYGKCPARHTFKLEFSTCSKPVGIRTARMKFPSLANSKYPAPSMRISIMYLPHLSYPVYLLSIYLRNAHSNPACSSIYQVFSLFIHALLPRYFSMAITAKKNITRANNNFRAYKMFKLKFFSSSIFVSISS